MSTRSSRAGTRRRKTVAGRKGAAPDAARRPSRGPSIRPASGGAGSGPPRWAAVLLAAGAVVLIAALALLVWGAVGGRPATRRVALAFPEDLDAAGTAALLAQHGLTHRPLLLSLYLRAYARTPVPGSHLLEDGLTPRQLAQRLGRSSLRPAVRVTLPEGLHHLQMATRLHEQGVVGRDAFVSAVRDRALLERLGLPGETAEGWLFPATYQLHVDSAPDAVVELLVAETRRRLERLRVAHADRVAALARELGLDDAALLSLAALVEKEARHADERPKVASVYLNRLRDPTFRPLRMLQADPTAAYGCVLEPERAPSCAGFDGRVTPAMVRDPANRWNTYRHPGLPPGPIANPGEASLVAVLTAPPSDWLYFVHVGGGRHRFSRTLSEHEAAIREAP